MTCSDVARPGEEWAGGLPPLLRVMLRYCVSTAGPVAVSAAHFLASLIFLRNLTTREFGLFSFVMVVVSFGMSIAGAMITVPITRSLLGDNPGIRAACLKANWLVCGLFGLLLAITLWANGAALPEAATLGLYGAVFAWRWVARNTAYVDGRVGAAIRSDFTYSILLASALGVLVLIHRLRFASGSEMMLLAALVALLPFGPAVFRAQLAALRDGRLRDYLPIFQDLGRWSLLGVVLTEVTVNAHAYLVTFISGPSSFALLALGMLMMRPAALVQSALPDMERPVMTRAIAAGDLEQLNRTQQYFTWGLAAAWIANMALVTGLLLFFPALLLKKGFSEHDVVLVAALSSAILLIRVFRGPLAVVMQAAGEFKALVNIGGVSGVASVIATLSLLLAFGPIASLLGIVLGELMILVRCWELARRWKAGHEDFARGIPAHA